MAYCARCGSGLESKDQFCSSCGQPAEKISPDISKKETVSSSFCDAKYNENDSAPAEETKANGKRKITFLKIVGFIMFLLLVAFGIFFANSQGRFESVDSFLYQVHMVISPPQQVFAEDPNLGVPAILFAENFDDKESIFWSVWVDEPTSDNPGWNIYVDGNDYYYEGRGHAFTLPPFIGGSDYSVSFRFNLKANGFHFNIRETAALGHYRYMVAVDQRGISLEKQATRNSSQGTSNKDFSVLVRSHHTIRFNQWYSLKVSVYRNQIRVYLDDIAIIDYEDNNSPYLDGSISFETLDDSIILIDDIIVTRDYLNGVEVTVPVEDRVDLPSLEASVLGLRFFKADHEGAYLGNRIYEIYFLSDEATFIWWELYLSCEPGRKTYFNLIAEYYNPEGEIIHAGVVENLWILNGWTESLHTGGFGYTRLNAWRPGIYEVRLYLDNVLIAAGNFEIYTEQQSENKSDSDQGIDSTEPFILEYFISLVDYEGDCGTIIEIADVFDDGILLGENTTQIQFVENEMILWGYGAKHTWLGELSLGGYTFSSDDDDPLQFELVRGQGYVYIKGKGTVAMPDGTVVNLPM